MQGCVGVCGFHIRTMLNSVDMEMHVETGWVTYLRFLNVVRRTDDADKILRSKVVNYCSMAIERSSIIEVKGQQR